MKQILGVILGIVNLVFCVAVLKMPSFAFFWLTPALIIAAILAIIVAVLTFENKKLMLTLIIIDLIGVAIMSSPLILA